MDQFPDGQVTAPRQPGKFLRVLRITGRIFGYLGIAIVLAVVVGYNYVMRPGFLEPLIVKQFAENTNGKIELKIEQASLFRGFRFTNVVVHPPAGFKATPILKAKEISLLYNVFGFFRGAFGVHEIALRDPEIFIEQKRNVFNAEALAKPGKAKEPEKKEKENEPETASDPVISWFFDVQVFARFVLENFNFTLDARDPSNKNRQYAHLKNFTFNFSLLTREFHRVDTANIASLVGILNALVIELNPQKTIDVAFEGAPARLNTKLDLFWRLFYDGGSKKPEFISQMHMGQDKIPVALANRAPQNLSFLIDHKIEYDAREDKIQIRNFDIKFLGDTVLALSGGGEKLLSKDRSFEFETGASRLNLGRVYQVVAGLTGKGNPSYAGFFSVKPTKVSLKGDTISDQGGIKLEGLQLRKDALFISIPTFEFDHAAKVDQKLKPIPVESASAKLRGSINGAGISLDAGIQPDRKTSVAFSLRGFDLTPFAAGQAQGQISTTLNIAGDSPQNLGLALRVFSPQLFYFLDRGKSGVNRIDFDVKGTIKSSEDFKQNTIHLPVISFTNKNKEYETAVDLKSHVNLEKGQNIKLVYGLDGLVVLFKELLSTMPVALQESLGSAIAAASPGRSVRADGETAVSVAGTETSVQHATHIAFPDIHVDDIALKAKARLVPAVTDLESFTVTGLREALKIAASGTIKQGFEQQTDEKTGKPVRVAVPQPDLRYSVELSKKEETEILDDTFLVGLFSLGGNVKGNIVNGNIKIDNFSFRNKQARVHKVNMLFPFKHDLKLKKTLNLRAGNKERIIKNYNFNRANNFTIQDIEIPDPNQKGEWMKIIYSRGNYPAIGGSMEYKDNVFVMPVLQLYMLNGVITISDTLFNLGRLKPSEMEYSTTMQIKDIDLKQLMRKDRADAVSDGKLRIDMLLTGNRLDKPIENLNGYFSIYRIGPEFAETVMKAAMPDSGIVSWIASNTTIPKRINIELKDGFVYSDIPMDKKFFAYLAPSPNEINNRRINIPEFFQRISNEASAYRAPAENSGN